jgi:hypothetical protein
MYFGDLWKTLYKTVCNKFGGGIFQWTIGILAFVILLFEGNIYAYGNVVFRYGCRKILVSVPTS